MFNDKPRASLQYFTATRIISILLSILLLLNVMSYFDTAFIRNVEAQAPVDTPPCVDGSTGTANTTWYTDAGGATVDAPYIIKTGDDLKGLADLVNGGKDFKGKYIKVAPSSASGKIDIIHYTGHFYGNPEMWNGRGGIGTGGELGWTPIGADSTHAFKGNFDGNNVEILNMACNFTTTKYTGLFGYADFSGGGYIKNIKLTEVQMKNTSTEAVVGALVGYVKSGIVADTIIGCSASPKTMAGLSPFTIKTNGITGGLIGQCDVIGAQTTDVISGCGVSKAGGYNFIIQNEGNLEVGGLIGKSSANLGTATVEANIVKSPTAQADINMGGVVGNSTGGSFTGCKFTGEIALSDDTTQNKPKAFVGGISNTASSKIDSCEVYANINIRKTINISSEVGGIVSTYSGNSISNCISNANLDIANIDINSGVGGLVGVTTSLNPSISQNIYYGSINVNSNFQSPVYVGGLVGCVKKGIAMSKCISSVNANFQSQGLSGHLGGAIGYTDNSGDVILSETFTTGLLKSNGYIGGLISGFTNYNKVNCITDSYSSASIDCTDAGRTSGGIFGILNSKNAIGAGVYFSGFLKSPLSVSISDNLDKYGSKVSALYDKQNTPHYATLNNPEFNRYDNALSSKTISEIKTAFASNTKYNTSVVGAYPSLTWIDSLSEGSFKTTAKALSDESTKQLVDFGLNAHSYTINLPITLNAEFQWKSGITTITSGAYTMVGDVETLVATKIITLNGKEYTFTKEVRLVKKVAIDGDGLSKASSYNVTDLVEFSQLALLNNNRLGVFAGCNITLDGAMYDFTSVGAVRTSYIGTETAPFAGNFDGGNKIISNFKMSDSGELNSGFFGTTYKANVINTVMKTATATPGTRTAIRTGILIGYMEGSNIENSSVCGTITGDGNPSCTFGGLAGEITNGYVKNSSFTGDLNKPCNSGGIVGTAGVGAMVKSSYVVGNIGNGVGGNDVGGLVGRVTDKTAVVSSSFMFGNVTGNDNVGGIVGTSGVSNDRCGMIDCYAYGTITGNNNVGGILGDGIIIEGTAKTQTTINNSYFVGQVLSKGTAGAIVGNNALLANCYFDKQIAGTIPTKGSDVSKRDEGLLTSYITAATLPVGLETSFNAVSGKYPQLKNNVASVDLVSLSTHPIYQMDNVDYSYNMTKNFTANLPTGVTKTDADMDKLGYTVNEATYNKTNTALYGKGHISVQYTVDGYNLTIKTEFMKTPFEKGYGLNGIPFEIPDVQTLKAFRDWVNNGYAAAGAYYKLTTTTSYDLSAVASWTPIGTEEASFSGVFLGNGKTISGLKVNATDANATKVDSLGLFGVVKSARIQDLDVKSATLNVNYVNSFNAGILAGSMELSGLDNVTVEGIVTANETTALASDIYNVGGMVGKAVGSLTVTNCFSDVTVNIPTKSVVNSQLNSGGMIGYANIGEASAFKFEGCIVYGLIDNPKSAKNVYSGMLMGNAVGANVKNSRLYVKKSATYGRIIEGSVMGSIYGNGNNIETTSDLEYVKSFVSGVDFYSTDDANSIIGGIVGNMRIAMMNSFYFGRIDPDVVQRGGYCGANTPNAAEKSCAFDVSVNNIKPYYGGTTQQNIMHTTFFMAVDDYDGASVWLQNPDFEFPLLGNYPRLKGLTGERLETSKLNSVALYYVNAKNGISSVYEQTTNANLDVATDASVAKTISSSRVVSKETTATIYNPEVKITGVTSTNTKKIYYKPSVDSLGVTDISYQIADPNGDGINAVNSFTIYTADSLAGLSKVSDTKPPTDFAGKTIFMGRDIDADVYTKFPIIGTSAKPFKGSFNGNKHVIRNVKMSNSVGDTGLFGVLQGDISNLGLIDSRIEYTGSAATNVGSIVGKAVSSKITDSFSSAMVVSKSAGAVNIGGLVGIMDNTSGVASSYFTGNVIANTATNSYVGAIAGSASGSITDSYVAGFIEGKVNYVGTVAGTVNNLTISGVYADKLACGSVRAVGGGSYSGSVKTVSTDEMVATQDGKKPDMLSGIGGEFSFTKGLYPRLSGFTQDIISAIPIYYTTNVNSVTMAQVGYDTATLSPKLGYIEHSGNFTLDSAQKMLTKSASGKAATNLKYGTDFREATMYLKCWYENDGSGVYKIANGADLLEFSQIVNGTFSSHTHGSLPQKFDFAGKTVELADDINMKGIAGLAPITGFKGTFDGKGYVIYNLTISSGEPNVGLFGEIGNNVTVKHVGFTNSAVVSTNGTNVNIGMVAGKLSGGARVENCFSMGQLTADATTAGSVNLGSIVGEVSSGTTVSGCYNMANVNATATNSVGVKAGGISGENLGTVEYCYNTGIISGSGKPGTPNQNKIAGISGNNSSIINNCYNAGLIFNTATTNFTEPITFGTAPTLSYYDKQINNMVTYQYGTGILTNAFKDSADFKSANWQIQEGCYPQLTAFTQSLNNTEKVASVVSATETTFYNTSGFGSYDSLTKVDLISQATIGSDTVLIGVANKGTGSGAFNVVTNNGKHTLEPTLKGSTYVTISASGYSLVKRDFMFNIVQMLALRYKFDFSELTSTQAPRNTTPVGKTSGVADTSFAGNGTSGNPYLIATPEELLGLANLVNAGSTTDGKYYKLDAPLNMAGVSMPSIGTSQHPFNAVFDGDAYTVANVTLTGSYTGFFGVIGEKGTVKHLGLTSINVSVLGSDVDLVGGLIAAENKGKLQSVYAVGVLSGAKPTDGKYLKMGGVVGINSGRITGCYIRTNNADNKGLISGAILKQYTYTATLVGENNGYMSGCYTTIDGSVNLSAKANALVGRNSGTVSNCYYDKDIIQGEYVIVYNDALGQPIYTSADYAKSTAEFKNTAPDFGKDTVAHLLSRDLYLGTYEYALNANNGYPVHGAVLLSKYNFTDFGVNPAMILNIQNLNLNKDEYNASNAVCSYKGFVFPQFGRIAIGKSITVNILDLPISVGASFTAYGYGISQDGKTEEKTTLMVSDSVINTAGGMPYDTRRIEIYIKLRPNGKPMTKPWGVSQEIILPKG